MQSKVFIYYIYISVKKKDLCAEYIKNFYNLIKTLNSLIFENAKDLNRHFTKEDTSLPHGQ